MGHPASKLESQPSLRLYNPDEEVLEGVYDRWLRKTRSPEAAAMLVLATVHFAPSARLSEQSEHRAEYLTVKEAARKYNLGERTIYRIVEQGLPVTRAGKAIRIKPRDLEKWLANSETILR